MTDQEYSVERRNFQRHRYDGLVSRVSSCPGIGPCIRVAGPRGLPDSPSVVSIKQSALYQELSLRLVFIGCFVSLGAMGFGFDNSWWGGALGLSPFG
jgi:hypothetical protein